MLELFLLFSILCVLTLFLLLSYFDMNVTGFHRVISNFILSNPIYSTKVYKKAVWLFLQKKKRFHFSVEGNDPIIQEVFTTGEAFQTRTE